MQRNKILGHEATYKIIANTILVEYFAFLFDI